MLEEKTWKYFSLDKLFNIRAGIYYYSHEYEEGDTPYISASNENNGIQQRINIEPDFEGNCIVTGKVGCTAFYQSENFCATSDVNILRPRNFELDTELGLFIATIINFSENYKWNYGRQCRIGDSKKIKIKLPVELNHNKEPKIDKKKIFSDEGYIPDWNFMRYFMCEIQNREKNKIKELLNM